MQKCEQCGTGTAEQARFCTSCGHRLHSGGADGADGAGGTADPGVGTRTYAGVLVPPDPGPRRRPWSAGVVGLVAVALVAGGFVLGLVVGDDDDGARPGAGGADAVAPGEDDVHDGDLRRVVPGVVEELPVEDGTAAAELVVAASPGVVLRVDVGRVSVTDETGATVADDADSVVLDLGPGLYEVRVDDVEAEVVVLAVGEVVDEPFGGDRTVAGELSEEAPVVRAVVEPTVYQGWRLVDASPDEVDAALHDVTDLADGEAPATDAPVVCDGSERECRLEQGRRYLLEVRALDLPAAFDISFEDLLDRTGPSSVLVDGEPSPVAVTLAAGETTTVDLAIGHRGDVVVQVTPAADVDVSVAVDDREADGGGPGAAESIRVTAEEIEDAFGFLDLELTARDGDGVAFVIAEPR